MKKNLIVMMFVAAMTTLMIGCGSTKTPEAPAENTTAYVDNTDTEEPVEEIEEVEEVEAPEEPEGIGMANPMVESTYEEIVKVTGCKAVVPKNAEYPTYYLISNELGDIRYSYGNGSTLATLRVQRCDEFTDISGTNIDPSLFDDYGKIGECDAKGYVEFNSDSDEDDFGLVLWYDSEDKIMYSLDYRCSNIDGYDMGYAAEVVMQNMEEYPDSAPNNMEERTGRSEFESFDEIIGLLEPGEAYANTKVIGYNGEVLLVADQVYEAEDGSGIAAKSATAYTKKSNGKITCDGSIGWDADICHYIRIDDQGTLFFRTDSEADEYAYAEAVYGEQTIAEMKFVSEFGEPYVGFGYYRIPDSEELFHNDTVKYSEEEHMDELNAMYDDYDKCTLINFIPVE